VTHRLFEISVAAERTICRVRYAMEKNMEWKKIIDEGELRLCSGEEARAKKVYPNRLAWLAKQPKIGVVVVFQSETDFALGRAGLYYIVNAVRQQRIEKGFVLLLRKDNGKLEFVNAAPAEEIETALHNNRPPLEGAWGPYWWLPADLAEILAPETVPF